MGYDRGDSLPFDSEPNGIPFGSKSKGKLSPRSNPIQCERKCKYSFLSVAHSFGRPKQLVYDKRKLEEKGEGTPSETDTVNLTGIVVFKHVEIKFAKYK